MAIKRPIQTSPELESDITGHGAGGWFRRLLVFVTAGAVLLPTLAHAEGWPAADGQGGLPGIHRVVTGEPTRSGVGLFTGLGFGLTGEVIGTDDSHQRAIGSLAIGAGVTSWLALALRLEGRYDRHSEMLPDGTEATDDGWVGDPRLAVRLHTTLGDAWQVAGELVLWMPGANAPSVVAGAASGDAVLALSHARRDSPLRFGANLGFRLDNSAVSAMDAALLSQADRLSLGVSDSNAILMGLGAGYRLGRAEIFGEWTWDFLFGESAPDLLESPMRVAAGVRIDISRSLVAQLVAEANPAKLPDASPGSPLVPLVPRAAIMTGLHVRFGGKKKSEGPLVVEPEPEPPPKPEPPKPPPPAKLAGKVLSDGGEGIAGAKVTVKIGTETREATTDASGVFQIEGIPAGTAEVTIEAENFKENTRSVELVAGKQADLDLSLEAKLPEGQLRGIIRSYRGKPLEAEIEVQPLGLKVTTNPDGSFEIDVPPGDYEVVIQAKRYRQQRRRVTVENGGVTIVHVDLRRKRKR